MDLVLSLADEYLLDKAWSYIVPASVFVSPPLQANISQSSVVPTTWHHHLVSLLPHPPLPPSHDVSAWPRDYIPRQLLSLSAITLTGIFFLYFIFAGLSYRYIFNHEMMSHPRFLKNQVKLEIQCSLRAFPSMTLLTLPWFQAEVRGYSKLYDNVGDYGLVYLLFSIPFFLVFTDYGIYWVHRLLHHPLIYKYVHKPHHKWLIPTPFASHAFHPLDGLFVFVNFWSILIHDSDMITDRWGGSYRQPGFRA
ncbi:C5-sterol desaturase [Lactarius indigo]|nr:C5-sterol desaturase [Lactarius indigo]